MPEANPINWPLVGLILAGELIFAVVLAILTRLVATHKLPGQTYGLVVAGVAGVVVIAGAQIGWQNAGFLALCFAVAGLVMGVEYYTRILDEHDAAQKVRQDSIQ